jgi:hypothetical protein
MKRRLRHVQLCGSDKRMDESGSFDLPVNPLPIRCPRCTFPDLDCVPQPYFLAKGVRDPNEIAEGEAGNFFVRERARKILETVAPGACHFFPTQHLKTKALTPWSLAVPRFLVRTAAVKHSVRRCPQCNEPKVAHPGSHYTYPAVPPVAHDIYKSLNWSSSEKIAEEIPWYSRNVLGWREADAVPRSGWTRIALARQLWFSLRLEALLKSVGVKGLFRAFLDDEEPDAQDLAWAEEKRRFLADRGLAERRAPTSSPARDRWFQRFLKSHARRKQVPIDWRAIESKAGVPLPPSYKAFAAAVGEMTFPEVDGIEGFSVRIVPPTRLDARRYRKGRVSVTDRDSEAVDGLLFATTGHGDGFCFDLAVAGPEYPVYLYDHDLCAYEAYSADFPACIRRLSGK